LKVTEHDATEERRVLTGMVVDQTVLGHVVTKWRPDGLFRTRWANLVGGWCVGYYQRYNKAPGADLEGLFESWAATANDEDTVALVDRFLSDLSGDYEAEADDTNPEYLTDLAGNHFNTVLLERLADTVKGHVDRGAVDKAMEAVAGWGRVELGVGAGVDVLQDMDAVRAAFESNTEPLITYPGALGQFFGDQLGRDEFVAFTGATGRGKTWWLIDMAWMGVRQGRRVAFFTVGDMSQNQIMRRFMCRAAARPVRPPYEVEYPVSISRDDNDGPCSVETELRTFDGPLDWRMAWDACERKTRRFKRPLLRLSAHPSDAIGIDGIAGVLDVWERGGWVPDVVVIDYADTLAALPGYQPGDREAINATWLRMRGLSQSRHILLVTATQGDAGSYDAHTIRRGNFSNDRRKNDHVTAMYGINATEEETAQGVFRLNCTKRREAVYSESLCVYVAGCLALARPHVRSTF